MESNEVKPFTFLVATFNILAPIYKRIGLIKKESLYPERYLNRNADIVNVISEIQNIDVICLQEFWLDKSLMDIFNKKFSEKYNFYHRSRSYQPEGLGLFISKQYKVERVVGFNHPYSGRPFLFVFINVGGGKQLIITTVHLTYCSESERMMEIKAIIATLEGFMKNSKIIGVIFTGDFNSTRDSVIIQSLLKTGMTSSYHSIYGHEPAITHKDHRGNLSACDFIFFKALGENEIKPTLSQVHPTCYSHENWPAEFTASDHRMLSTEFHIHPK